MKIGLGLYRHMLSRDNYDFARQAGCTHIVIHLVDYFRQNSTNPRDNQPTGGKYGAWGLAGDPNALWTAGELIKIRREIEDAGLGSAAIENLDPAFWHDILLDGPSALNILKISKPSFVAWEKPAFPFLAITSVSPESAAVFPGPGDAEVPSPSEWTDLLTSPFRMEWCGT